MTAEINEIGNLFYVSLKGFDSIDIVKLVKLFNDTKRINKVSLSVQDTQYKGEAILRLEGIKNKQVTGYYKEKK